MGSRWPNSAWWAMPTNQSMVSVGQQFVTSCNSKLIIQMPPQCCSNRTIALPKIFLAQRMPLSPRMNLGKRRIYGLMLVRVHRSRVMSQSQSMTRPSLLKARLDHYKIWANQILAIPQFSIVQMPNLVSLKKSLCEPRSLIKSLVGCASMSAKR